MYEQQTLIVSLHFTKIINLFLKFWSVNNNVVPGSTKMLTQEHVALGKIRFSKKRHALKKRYFFLGMNLCLSCFTHENRKNQQVVVFEYLV